MLQAATLKGALTQLMAVATEFPAKDWAEMIGRYAGMSTPGLLNPAIMSQTAKTIITPVLAPVLASTHSSPSPFIDALEASLVTFWTAAIPLAAPATPQVLALPTLKAPMLAAMTAALATKDSAVAAERVAGALDSWTKTILYGPVPPAPPVTPLT